jgi:hypothetical protein
VWNRRKTLCLAAALIIASLLVCFPATAIADGGPVLSDPQLWAQLEEGQQTAVVTLSNDDTVDVDLFVSLLDNSGESHEVVFFVPLGIDPTGFNVTEKTSLEFDDELIQQLDYALRKEAEWETNIWLSLLPPTLLTNGGWLLALGLPLLLSGCGGAGTPSPEESYETDSSRVDIYGLDEDTDLEALINTTGLNPSVQETLSRLTGQRIAIVTLQTQPPLLAGDETWYDWYGLTGQPGIHLSWTTALVAQSDSVAYSYPLGTGSSWASPIGLTRIYVVAPPGMDFTAEYPRLGADYSGYSSNLAQVPFFMSYSPRPLIMDHYDTPAYAIDEARGDFGHIWRAIYTHSNSAEDVVISLAPSGGALTAIRRSLAGLGTAPTILLGLLIALLLWVVAWRYIMPRMLGMEYRWRGSRLWSDSLTYLGINVGVVLAVAALAAGAFLLALLMGAYIGSNAGYVVGLVVAGILIAVAAFGVPSILLFARSRRRELGVSRGRAAGAYIVTALVANAAYLALAFGYAALAGAI